MMPKFPDKLKVGRVVYTIDPKADHTVLDGADGCCFGEPPKIFLNKECQCPGEVAFHEICHAVEKEFALRFFDDEPHTAYLYQLYIVLRENRLLATSLYCKDAIEKVGNAKSSKD